MLFLASLYSLVSGLYGRRSFLAQGSSTGQWECALVIYILLDFCRKMFL